jgi:hypothetical protein
MSPALTAAYQTWTGAEEVSLPALLQKAFDTLEKEVVSL